MLFGLPSRESRLQLGFLVDIIGKLIRYRLHIMFLFEKHVDLINSVIHRAVLSVFRVSHTVYTQIHILENNYERLQISEILLKRQTRSTKNNMVLW